MIPHHQSNSSLKLAQGLRVIGRGTFRMGSSSDFGQNFTFLTLLPCITGQGYTFLKISTCVSHSKILHRLPHYLPRVMVIHDYTCFPLVLAPTNNKYSTNCQSNSATKAAN